MPIAKGAKTTVVLDFEDSGGYGEDPASPAGLLMPVNYPITFNATQAKNKANRAGGTRNPRKPFGGNVDVTASLVVPVDYTAFWYWLKLMFGDPTTTGAGPYVHVFKVGDDMPSAVNERQFPDITQYFKYNGMMVSKLSMEIGGDGELVASLSLMGADETAGSTPYDATPTTITENPFYNFQATVKEGGSSFADMLNWKLDVDFGLDNSFRPIGNAGKVKEMMPGGITITGSYTAAFRDLSLYNKGLNNTETSIQQTITSGTNILDIKLPEVEYERPTIAVSTAMGVMQDVKFHGFYENDAAASAIVVTLTNGDAHA